MFYIQLEWFHIKYLDVIYLNNNYDITHLGSTFVWINCRVYESISCSYPFEIIKLLMQLSKDYKTLHTLIRHYLRHV